MEEWGFLVGREFFFPAPTVIRKKLEALKILLTFVFKMYSFALFLKIRFCITFFNTNFLTKPVLFVVLFFSYSRPYNFQLIEQINTNLLRVCKQYFTNGNDNNRQIRLILFRVNLIGSSTTGQYIYRYDTLLLFSLSEYYAVFL